jgi:GGDEF domain-containing protein
MNLDGFTSPEAFALEAALLLEALKERQALREVARTDPLTGLLHPGLEGEDAPTLVARLRESLPYSAAAGSLGVGAEGLEATLAEADRRMYRNKRAKGGP